MEREQKQKNYLNAQRFVVVFTWLSSAAKEKHKTDYINMKLYPQQQEDNRQNGLDKSQPERYLA